MVGPLIKNKYKIKIKKQINPQEFREVLQTPKQNKIMVLGALNETTGNIPIPSIMFAIMNTISMVTEKSATHKQYIFIHSTLINDNLTTT